MKAREGSRRFLDPKKRLAPGEVLRKFGWRRGVACEKLCRRLQEFGKKVPGVQRVKPFHLKYHRLLNQLTLQYIYQIETYQIRTCCMDQLYHSS